MFVVAGFAAVWVSQTGTAIDERDEQQAGETSATPTAPQTVPTGGPKALLDHDVYISFSSDPASFPVGTLVTESASVPDVLVCVEGSVACEPNELLVYFVDPINTTNSMEGVSVMRSKDGGKTWSERTSISVAAKTNKGPAVDPSIVQLADGSIRMYYFGPDKPFAGPGSSGNVSTTENAVYSATSTDGVHFVQDTGVRFSAMRLTDPEVVVRNDQWFLYYSVGTQSGVATSSDGLIFVDQGVIAAQTGGVPGAYVLEDGRVLLYGCTRDGILVSESADGQEPFSNVGGLFETKQPGACDPAVDSLNGEYVLIYKKVDAAAQTSTPTFAP